MRTKEQILESIRNQADSFDETLVIELVCDVRDALFDIAAAIREHPSSSGIASPGVNPKWHLRGEDSA